MMISRALPFGLAALLLAACATSAPPPMALEDARAQVREAGADPDVARFARPELESAQDAFANAERGMRRQLDRQVIEHWAYLAQQRAATARETARLRRAEEEIAASRAAPPAQAAVPDAPSGAVERSPLAADGALRFGDDQFEANRFTPNPEAAAALDRVARLLQEDPSRTARVDGHSDDMNSREQSLVFTGRRADSVRGELVRRGIDPRRIQVRALGDSYPVASNDTEIGRQRNRRVDVYVLGNGTPVPLP